MARTFDGVDDVIEVTASSALETPTTALTAAVLFRPSSTNEAYGGMIYKTNDSANSWAILQEASTTMNYYCELQSTDITASLNEAAMTVDTYYWFVYRWASGSQMSLRVYNMDGTTNQTVTSAATVTHTITYGGSSRPLRFGQNEATGNLGGDAAVAAVWASSLSDDQVSSMMVSLQAMLSLAPAAAWLFDQSATGQNVIDLTGGGANQSAITGTAVATASVPGFGYGQDLFEVLSTTAVAPPPPDLAWIRPLMSPLQPAR